MDLGTFLKSTNKQQEKKIWGFKPSVSKGFMVFSNSNFFFHKNIQQKKGFSKKKQNPVFIRFSTFFQTSQLKNIYDQTKNKRNARKHGQNRKLFYLGIPFKPVFFNWKRNFRVPNYFKNNFFLTINKTFFDVYFQKFLGKIRTTRNFDFDEKKDQLKNLLVFNLKKRRIKFSPKNLIKKEFKARDSRCKEFKAGFQIFSPFGKFFYKGEKGDDRNFRKDFVISTNPSIHWKRKEFLRRNDQGISSYFSNKKNNFFYHLQETDLGFISSFLEKKLNFRKEKKKLKFQNISKKNFCLILNKNDRENPSNRKFFFGFYSTKSSKMKNQSGSQKIMNPGERKRLKILNLSGLKKNEIARDMDCFFVFFFSFHGYEFKDLNLISGLIIKQDLVFFSNPKKSFHVQVWGDKLYFFFHFLRNFLILFFSENERKGRNFSQKNFFFILKEFRKLEKKKKCCRKKIKLGKRLDFLCLERFQKKNWYFGIRNFFWERIDLDFFHLEDLGFYESFLNIKEFSKNFFVDLSLKKPNLERNVTEIFFEPKKQKKTGKRLEKNFFFDKKKIKFFFRNKSRLSSLLKFSALDLRGEDKNLYKPIPPFFESSFFKKLNQTDRTIRDLENFLGIFNGVDLNRCKRDLKTEHVPPSLYMFSQPLIEKKQKMAFKLYSRNWDISSRIGFVFVSTEIPLVFFNNQFSNFETFSNEQFFRSSLLKNNSEIQRENLFSIFMELKVGRVSSIRKIFNRHNEFTGNNILNIQNRIVNLLKVIKTLIEKKKSKRFRKIKKKTP